MPIVQHVNTTISPYKLFKHLQWLKTELCPENVKLYCLHLELVNIYEP